MKNYEDELTELYGKKLKTKTDVLDAQRETQLKESENRAQSLERDYTETKNARAALSEKQRQSFNSSAAASGLNSGAGAQAILAMNSAAQKSAAQTDNGYLEAKEELRRSDEKAEASYRAGIAQAIAENDYERAKALFEEYKRRDSEAESEAKLKAGYGDFSGYEKLYGSESASAMKKLWIAKNPLLARNLGIISEAEFRKLKAK